MRGRATRSRHARTRSTRRGTQRGCSPSPPKGSRDSSAPRRTTGSSQSCWTCGARAPSRWPGRSDELSRADALRGRLELRLADVERRMRAATAAGDDDEAERLHARYIELGTTYAGRLVAGWRSTTD